MQLCIHFSWCLFIYVYVQKCMRKYVGLYSHYYMCTYVHIWNCTNICRYVYMFVRSKRSHVHEHIYGHLRACVYVSRRHVHVYKS